MTASGHAVLRPWPTPPLRRPHRVPPPHLRRRRAGMVTLATT